MTDAIVEMFIDGAWVDITADEDVYTRDEITVTRGKANEASQAAPAALQATLNNRDGKYSPRNPLSPYFGKIGRNTPIRMGLATPALKLEGGADDARTPDSVATSITGDIDVRIDLSLTSTSVWTSSYALCGKGDTNSTISWHLDLVGGNLRFQWSVLGTTEITATSTVDVPIPATGRQALRATLDVNNGASGNTVTFYTADTIDGTWTQLGSPVVTSGTTSIFNGATSTYIGESTPTEFFAPNCNVYSFEMRSGIGGTVVSRVDFKDATIGASTYTDPQGNTWTLNSGASFVGALVGDAIRSWGEVASFPPKWELSGKDAWVPIEAAGLLRRLNQGVDAPASGLRDLILPSDGLFVYYPLTGGVGTTYSVGLFGSGISGTQRRLYAYPATPPSGPTYAYGAEYASGLGTGLQLTNTGTTGYLIGEGGSAYNYAAIDLVFQSPSLGDLTYILDDYRGILWTVDLSGGVAQVSFTDPETGPIGFSATGTLGALSDGLMHHLRLEILKNGTGTDWELYIDGDSVDSGSQASYNLTGVNRVRVLYSSSDPETPVTIGHVAIWSDSSQTWPTAADLTLAMNGYASETAGNRIERLVEGAGYTFISSGDLDDTTPMGPQFGEGLLPQLRDAEGTDLGILTEPRDAFGLTYLTRTSLYNQTAKATLDYSAGHLYPPFEPVDDDQLTRNDVTVTKREAGSFRVTIDEGPLSTQEPPDGVGKYSDDVTVNTYTEGQLPGIASWLARLGTLDEARFPSVSVNLASPDIDDDLAADLLSVDVGDVIVITNASAVNIYDDVRLLVLGYTETIGPVEHIITFNCAPASPYDVATYDTSKYDTAGSELTSDVTSTATSLSVTETGGTLWTTDDTAFPFDIRVGGERMTVTDISSTTSPQSFTVTRSVNGVVKAHSAGADVRLWNTPRYAL